MLFKKKNPLPASQDFHNSQHSVTSSQHTVLQGCSSSADGARNHFNLFYHGRQRPQSVSDCAYWRPTRYKRENRGSRRCRKSIFPGRHDWEYVFGWTEKDMASSLYLLSRHSQNYFIFIGTQVNFHSLQSRLANFTKLGIIYRGPHETEHRKWSLRTVQWSQAWWEVTETHEHPGTRWQAPLAPDLSVLPEVEVLDSYCL